MYLVMRPFGLELLKGGGKNMNGQFVVRITGHFREGAVLINIIMHRVSVPESGISLQISAFLGVSQDVCCTKTSPWQGGDATLSRCIILAVAHLRHRAFMQQ